MHRRRYGHRDVSAILTRSGIGEAAREANAKIRDLSEDKVQSRSAAINGASLTRHGAVSSHMDTAPTMLLHNREHAPHIMK